MASVCYDCKLGYGHPLSWCPGCGRHMVNVKTCDWNELRRNNWRLEGDKELYEYFIDGKQISTNVYKTLYHDCKLAYPKIFEQFNLPNEWDGEYPMPSPSKWIHFDRYSQLAIEIKDKISIRFDYPRVVWRLKGSNLEVINGTNYVSLGKEPEFDRSKL